MSAPRADTAAGAVVTSREGKAATYAGLTPLSRSRGRIEGRPRSACGVNKHALRANYLSALAAVRDSALDAAYYRKQHACHEGHPKPHLVALLALARQRFKVVYKLMTTDTAYDKRSSSPVTSTASAKTRTTAHERPSACPHPTPFDFTLTSE